MVGNDEDMSWMRPGDCGWSEGVEHLWKSLRPFGGGITWNVSDSITVSVVGAGFQQVGALTFNLKVSMPATRKVKRSNENAGKKRTMRGSRTADGILTPLSSESQTEMSG